MLGAARRAGATPALRLRGRAIDDLIGVLGAAGAVRAAVEATLDLDPVADHRAVAVLAARRHAADGALEAVEGVVIAGGNHLEGLVVVVAAHLADGHGDDLPIGVLGASGLGRTRVPRVPGTSPP